MTPDNLEKRIATLSQDTLVRVNDLTGTSDHFEAVVVSSVFEGKSMLEQHRLVYDLLNAEIQSGEVHALTLKTYSPKQAERLGVG